MIDQTDVENRFAFHAATTDEKRDAHTSVRQRCRRLADFLNEQLEVMFWGNAALARLEPHAEHVGEPT